jgi:hypothetical protein
MKRASLSRAIPAAERRTILAEYESYPRGYARRGALLRRYGIYTSQVAKWRLRRDQGDDTWRTQPVVTECERQAGQCSAVEASSRCCGFRRNFLKILKTNREYFSMIKVLTSNVLLPIFESLSSSRV